MNITNISCFLRKPLRHFDHAEAAIFFLLESFSLFLLFHLDAAAVDFLPVPPFRRFVQHDERVERATPFTQPPSAVKSLKKWAKESGGGEVISISF